jgi:hypothetical protein
MKPSGVVHGEQREPDGDGGNGAEHGFLKINILCF